MRIYLSILLFLCCACTNSNEKAPEDILSKKKFQNILQEIHLNEANIELKSTFRNKKKEEKNSNLSIYKKHQVSEKNFKKTLRYYSENPEKLEAVYSVILKQLTLEKATLDPQ